MGTCKLSGAPSQSPGRIWLVERVGPQVSLCPRGQNSGISNTEVQKRVHVAARRIQDTCLHNVRMCSYAPMSLVGQTESGGGYVCSWQWSTSVDFCAPAVGGGDLGETVSGFGCQGQLQLPFLFNTVFCSCFVRADGQGVLWVHLSGIKQEHFLAYTPEPGGPSWPCGRGPKLFLGDDLQSRVPRFLVPSVQIPPHQPCSISFCRRHLFITFIPGQVVWRHDDHIHRVNNSLLRILCVQLRPLSFTSVSLRRHPNHVLSEGGASHQRKHLIHIMFHVCKTVAVHTMRRSEKDRHSYWEDRGLHPTVQSRCWRHFFPLLHNECGRIQ